MRKYAVSSRFSAPLVVRGTAAARYIAWPGQALAYKIGQLTILRLREKARAELGPKFDIRDFHDEVLGAGALPMDIFEQRIDAWIERVKRREQKKTNS